MQTPTPYGLAAAGRIALGGRLTGASRPPAVVWVPAAAVAGAMLLPLAYLVVRTLGAGPEALALLFRTRTLGIVLRSLVLVATVTTASVAIAVPLAWLTVRTDLPLRRAWSVLTALPLVVPSYVGGFVVVVALGPRGMLQGLLAPVGVERLPEIYGLPGAALTITLLSFPYVLLTVRAALWRLDPAQTEAARSLGHGAWTTFRRVTLPLLRPGIAGGALLVALYTLSDFGAVSLLRYETFTWAIYVQYESAFDRTLAASLSLVLVAAALGLVAMEGRIRGRARYYSSGAGTTRPFGLVRLGRWRWPALAFCGAVVLLSLVLPTGVLGYWLVRGLAAGEPVRPVWSAMLNSLSVSGLAVLVAVAAAAPVAILAVRYPGWVAWLIERTSFVGFALPGIVVALALVFFGARYAPPLYQTIVLLVFAYVVLFIPQAIGALRAALLQVRPQLEEAARSLGRRPLDVASRVTFPLVRPGVLAGATLVFLTAMKELPATLLLSPVGFRTLATSIWAATEEAFFARAAAPALMLIAVSAVPTAVLLFRDPGRRA